MHRFGDQRTGERHSQIVQIEDETVDIVVERRDSLDDHRWHEYVRVARNDELDGMRGVGAHGQFVSLSIENGERHGSREIVVDVDGRRVGRCQRLHDRLSKRSKENRSKRESVKRRGYELEETQLSRW